jgi:hypothetical protein
MDDTGLSKYLATHIEHQNNIKSTISSMVMYTVIENSTRKLGTHELNLNLTLNPNVLYKLVRE